MNCNRLSLSWTLTAGLALSPILASTPALAGSGEDQVPVGPRPLALGGAYTAVAEGADALYWNPAGLGRLRVSSLRATTANQFGLGIRDNLLSLASPAWQGLGFGLEWYHSGFSDGGLEDGLNRISFGLGWQPVRRVSLGAAAKYRQYKQTYQSVDQGTGSGIGMDFGALVMPRHNVSLGVAWRDAGGSTLRYDDGSTSRPFDGVLAAGGAWQVIPTVLVVADVDRDAHAGVEWQLLQALAVRGGWTKDLDGLDGSRLSLGFGLQYGPATICYSFQSHPMLDATHTFGVAVDFTLAPKLVDVSDASLQPLFASFYKTYATEPTGEVVLTSLTDQPVEVRVSVMQKQVMDEPSERTLYLRPGAATRVPVTLPLSPRVVELREGRPMPFTVEVTYQSAGRRRNESRKVQTFMYEPGVLTWGDGVERAAAFITPSNELVSDFTRDIVKATAAQDRGVLNRTTTLAARLFDGLAACGITYTPDALNPYGAMRDKPFAVDNIQYPAELLVHRSGDCDDSSVLYATMLENVGIRTALVDVPEHIYVMFDTGIHARERDATGLDPALFVEREGSLWIPVETTALGAPFHQAWRKGADLFRRWEGSDKLHVVDVLQARARYEAAVYAARIPAGAKAPVVDASTVTRAVSEDLAQIGGWRDDFLKQTYLAHLGQENPTQDAIKLARVYYLNRDYDRAYTELVSVSEGARDAALWNNLGNTELARGDDRVALRSYDRARAMDSDDPGIALNRGLALHVLGRSDEGQKELSRAVHKAGSVAAALQMLGVKADATVASGGRAGEAVALEQLSLQRVEELLKQAMSAVPEPLLAQQDTVAAATAGADSARDGRRVPGLAAAQPDSLARALGGASQATTTGAPDTARTTKQDSTAANGAAGLPQRTVPGGSRGAKIEAETLHDVLYWKSPAGTK
jgi:tetratricopeptide (TPR) repeat protein